MSAVRGGGVAQDTKVEQFKVEQTAALLKFLRTAYADEPRKSDPAFWTWHYLENPNTKTEDVPLWVVRCGPEIIGQMATIPVRIRAGSSERDAIWVLDFIVREDFRGKGLGKRLVLAAREKYPTMITLGINEQSAGLFRSLGWAEMGTIHRYQRLLYAGNGLRGARVAAVRGTLNLLSAPMRWRPKDRASESYTVKSVRVFGTEFDELWARAAGQWPCVARRDAKALAWQFGRQPGKTFEILGKYENGRLCGYAVLFFRKPIAGRGPEKAAISDLFYETGTTQEKARETVATLIRGALRMAIERRAGSLVTDICDELVEENLREYGFWRIAKSPQFMAWTDDEKDRVCRLENWYLTRGDADVSIIEQPNVV